MALTVAQVAAAIRAGDSPEELEQVTRLLRFAQDEVTRGRAHGP